MRRFFIKNSTGVVWDLTTGTGDPFLDKPKGLGIVNADTYEQLGGGFFATTAVKTGQAAVSGDLVFRNNAYARYQEFMKFISTGGLRVGYAPLAQVYYAACRVKTITKTEMDSDYGLLTVGIELTLLSPWAKESPSIMSISSESSSLTYPSTYPMTYGTEAGGELTFTISGGAEGAMDIELPGTLNNPSLKLYHLDGDWQLLGAVEITGSVTQLRYSNRPDESYIRTESGTDLTDSVSMDYDAFARPKLGKNKLVVEADNTFSGSATVKVYDYYRGV